jgi:hypothetical protein
MREGGPAGGGSAGASIVALVLVSLSMLMSGCETYWGEQDFVEISKKNKREDSIWRASTTNTRFVDVSWIFLGKRKP